VKHATVSVVIPCYGQAHFLREAIESVIAQNHPPEIVVVDDGSPDNTAEVAARYPQVRYVRQQNKGLAEARSSGFRVATGDYLMFLDADDRLTPNAVAAHLKCFAEHPKAQLAVGDIDHIAEDGSYLHSPSWPSGHSLSLHRECVGRSRACNAVPR
jgi:glycosyltransferase involved in cell wall biosynthesis